MTAFCVYFVSHFCQTILFHSMHSTVPISLFGFVVILMFGIGFCRLQNLSFQNRHSWHLFGAITVWLGPQQKSFECNPHQKCNRYTHVTNIMTHNSLTPFIIFQFCSASTVRLVLPLPLLLMLMLCVSARVIFYSRAHYLTTNHSVTQLQVF